MTKERFRRSRTWGSILVWVLVAALGYGGISVCIAADGRTVGGYTYCCRYWCGPDSCGHPSIHLSSGGLDALPGFMLSGGEGSCLDIPCLMVDRGRAFLVVHVLASPALETPVTETCPGAFLIADVPTPGLFLLRYSRSDPTSESIRSTILII